MNLKLLILDIDGILTDGTKVYDVEHKPIYKRFMCKDFTAIKRFSAAGIKVIMISGDKSKMETKKEGNQPVVVPSATGSDSTNDNVSQSNLLAKKNT